MSRFQNEGPGAMTGVSQIKTVLSEGNRVGVPSASKKRMAGVTPEVPLRQDQMARAWTALSHQYCRMCLNELNKRMFSGEGIVVFQDNEPRTPSDLFRTVLQRDFVPFARDALNAIMAFGVVPIAFRRALGSGLGEYDVVPYVPKFGTYAITTWTEAGLQRFRFYWTSGPMMSYPASGLWAGNNGPYGDRDDSVMVAHDFGYEPNVDGSLTSNMHAIANQLSVIGEFTGLALTAERIASNPPLVTEYNSAIENRAEDKFTENFYVGNPDRCLNNAERVYERSAQQRAIFRENMQQWEQTTGMSAREEFGDDVHGAPRKGANEPQGYLPPEWARDWKGQEMPWSRQYYLDPTRHLVQTQLPRSRGDLVSMSDQAMSVVCAVLNVPRGILVADSHVRAGVEAVSEAMHRTTNQWADILSTLMTAVYNHTFGIKDLRDELRIRMERKRKTPYDTADRLLTENDLFEAEAKTRVRLLFDLPPSTSPVRLDALYNRGLITWETYGTAQLRLHNLSRKQLANDTDPLSREHQLQLLLGKDKQSKQPE